jgi:hypothetical protein
VFKIFVTKLRVVSPEDRQSSHHRIYRIRQPSMYKVLQVDAVWRRISDIGKMGKHATIVATRSQVNSQGSSDLFSVLLDYAAQYPMKYKTGEITRWA